MYHRHTLILIWSLQVVQSLNSQRFDAGCTLLGNREHSPGYILRITSTQAQIYFWQAASYKCSGLCVCVLIYQHLFIWGKMIIHEERLRALRLFEADPCFLCNNFLRPVCFVHTYAERNKYFQSSSSKSGSVLWWEDLLGKWYVCQKNMSKSNQICDVNFLFQRNWRQPGIHGEAWAV